jgi:hypothetical protein
LVFGGFSFSHISIKEQHMKSIVRLASLAAAVLFMFGTQAFAACGGSPAAQNCGPAPGAILDLDGTAIPHVYTLYSVNFTATDSHTNISFAFREDPAFEFLDDVSVTHGVGPNLITNGDFEAGPVGAAAPSGWTYLNTYNATFPGFVNNVAGLAHGGSNYYYDGAVQAYDGITQQIATTAGQTYTISFWLNDNSAQTTFSRLSTNGDTLDVGGNGIDVLVYAGGVPNLTAPEPASAALLFVGVGGLVALMRRKAK